MSISVVRAAVARRVAETNLRAVADEIGMSWSGLRSFLEGGSPHLKTRQNLLRWYYLRTARKPAPPREDFETARAMLLSYVNDTSTPKSVRERRRRELIDLLNENSE